ncbi:hypothetical protein NPIL_657801 [Nephila pilipes]|uniref:Uncharacterized protein n=1 Tax=Nephila pilipes TaxID=299642 RepID=A0A8X6JH45_NEPPI|nr:hypothetical protein NPIL_657801 [Nephila pilipes]
MLKFFYAKAAKQRIFLRPPILGESLSIWIEESNFAIGGSLMQLSEAVKEDIKTSCSELLYGSTLQILSDMMETSALPPCDGFLVNRL